MVVGMELCQKLHRDLVGVGRESGVGAGVRLLSCVGAVGVLVKVVLFESAWIGVSDGLFVMVYVNHRVGAAGLWSGAPVLSIVMYMYDLVGTVVVRLGFFRERSLHPLDRLVGLLYT